MNVFLMSISGFCISIMQALLFRERFAAFQGLDFLLGITCAHFIAAIVAGLLFLHKSKHAQMQYQSVVYLIIGSFLLSFIFTRLIGFFIDSLGAPISLNFAFFYSFLVIFPPTFFQTCIVGVTVSVARFAYAALFQNPLQTIAIGYILGALFFSLTLIKVNSFAIALSVCAILVALAISTIQNKQKKIILLITIAIITTIGGKFSFNIDKAMLELSFKDSNIEDLRYSDYAQNVLINKKGQYFLLSNHIPIFSLPDNKPINTQDFAHLSILSHNNPKNILIIADASRYLVSALKYNADIDYLELDETIAEILKTKRMAIFNDEKISLFGGINARDFIKGRQYDVIMLGAVYPANLFINSLYTQEFFAATAKSLKKGGFLALSLPGTNAYPLFLIMELNASIISALERSFDFVNIIPAASQNIIIASQNKAPLRMEIKNRLTKIQDETFVMSKYHIDDRMDAQKTAWTLAQLTKIDRENIANSDSNPAAMMFDFLRRQADMYPRESFLLEKARRSFYVFFALAALAVFIRDRSKKTALMSAVSSLWLAFISIFLLQVWTGKILKFSGFFAALTLIGILAAAMASKFIFRQISPNKTLLYIDAICLLWTVLFFVAFKFSFINISFLLVSSLITAFICGLEIISLVKNKRSSEVLNSNDGQIMIFFGIGAWAASLFGGGYLIIAMGFEKALIFVFLIRFLIFCFWADPKKH